MYLIHHRKSVQILLPFTCPGKIQIFYSDSHSGYTCLASNGALEAHDPKHNLQKLKSCIYYHVELC